MCSEAYMSLTHGCLSATQACQCLELITSLGTARALCFHLWCLSELLHTAQGGAFILSAVKRMRHDDAGWVPISGFAQFA